MKYDPKAPPFWELVRGSGPISTRMQAYDKVREEEAREEEIMHRAMLSERKKVVR